MKNFIEVTKGNGEKYVINVHAINCVHLLTTGNTEIILNVPSSTGSHCVKPKETYEEIKVLIQEAL